MTAAIQALHDALQDAVAGREIQQMRLDQLAQRVVELEQAIAVLSGQPAATPDAPAPTPAEAPPAPPVEPLAAAPSPAEPAVLLCPECGEQFSTQRGLAGHISSHKRIDKQCPHCDRTLKSGPGYAAHVRFCPGPAAAVPEPAPDPARPVDPPAGLASVISDLGSAFGSGATVAHLAPARAEHPSMVQCACGHSERRHDAACGTCFAGSCGCTVFRTRGASPPAPAALAEPTTSTTEAAPSAQIGPVPDGLCTCGHGGMRHPGGEICELSLNCDCQGFEAVS